MPTSPRPALDPARRALVVRRVCLAIGLLVTACGGDAVAPEGPGADDDGDPLVLSTDSTSWGVSDGHACALTEDARAWCWGSNQSANWGRDRTARGASHPSPSGFRHANRS